MWSQFSTKVLLTIKDSSILKFRAEEDWRIEMIEGGGLK